MSIRTSLYTIHIKYKIVYYNLVAHNIHELNLIKVKLLYICQQKVVKLLIIYLKRIDEVNMLYAKISYSTYIKAIGFKALRANHIYPALFTGIVRRMNSTPCDLDR
jgi:hypothetical protein